MSVTAPAKRIRQALGLLTLGSLVGAAIVPFWLLFAATDLVALRTALDQPELRAAFLRTAAVTLLACGLASLLALPAGLLAHRRSLAWEPWLWLCGALPLAMPPLMTAAGVQYLLDGAIAWPAMDRLNEAIGNGGALLTVIYTLHYFPLILLAVSVAPRDRTQGLIDAARALGVGRVAIWRRVILPLALPGYLLGTAIAALRIIEDAATPLAVGAPDLLASRLLRSWVQPADGGTDLHAVALVLLLTASVIVLLTWSGLHRGQRRAAPANATPAPPRSRRWANGLVLLTLLAALTPYLLSALAIRDQLAGQAPQSWTAVHDSGLPTLVFALFTGLLVALGALLFGALTVARDNAAHVLRAAITMLMMLPALLLALALSRSLGADGPSTLHVAWLLLAVVVGLKLLPLGEYLVARALRVVYPVLRDTALALPGPARRLPAGAWRTTLPVVALCGVVGVAGLLAEVSAALVLLQQPARPLAVLMFGGMREAADWGNAALAMGLGAVTLSIVGVTLWRRAVWRNPAPILPGEDTWRP